LTLLADDFVLPNGLCFGLDERQLFVNDTRRGHIRVFDVLANGTLRGGSVWATPGSTGEGAPDGMKIDHGQRVCTGPAAFMCSTAMQRVFRHDARVPERVATSHGVTLIGARSISPLRHRCTLSAQTSPDIGHLLRRCSTCNGH
jgi:sugar lactone lactonase YvrE